MARYIVKRLLMLIPVMLGVMLVVFIFQAISPDDPVQMLLGNSATAEQKAELTAKLGLDRPVPVQFFKYVINLVTKGDLGTSYTSNQPVLTEIFQCWPYTILLAVGAVLLGVLIGVPLGILSAVKQYTWIDNAILGFSVFVASFPAFWLALILIIAFAVKLALLPSSGLASPLGWVLPIFVVAFQSMVNLIRTTRASMLETIRQDYVRTARAKGQKERLVIWSHVVRNSLIPVVNSIGITIGAQLGGVLIIETVFGIPGIGSYAVNAVNNRNYPAVLGSVVILAFVFSVVNLIVDICYTFIDPKLKNTFTAQAASKRRKRLKAKGAA
jgi:peptide/nickel transport system permease protein